MKIAELTLPPTRLSAGRILKKAGYQPLGKGSFATVWIRPGQPFALKLFTPIDQGYMSFIRLAQSVPNPHFPVIRGKPVKITDKYWAVRVELLAAPPSNFWKLIRACADYLGALQFVDEGIDLVHNQTLIKVFRRNNKSIAQAIDLMHQHVFRGNPNHLNDIDIRNCRVRGNTLVFIDPVGWGGGPMLFGENIQPSDDELQAIQADQQIKQKRRRSRRLVFVDMPGNDTVHPALSGMIAP